MRLLAVGLSHRTAPVELRESVDFGRAGLDAALHALAARGISPETVVLSTCNRAEVYALGDSDAAADALTRFFCDYHGLELAHLREHLYCHRGLDAARHLFRVAAGLDSLVVGEPQILGQVKTAYATASDLHFTGTVTHRLFHSAFAVGKRVRNETGLAEGAVSVSYAAIELAQQDLRRPLRPERPHPRRRRDGRAHGRPPARAARARDHDRQPDAGVGREPGAAARRPRRAVARSAPRARAADIVVTATGAAEPVLTRATVDEAMRSRRNRPLFVIDIALPRDVEAAVGDLEQVFLYHMDDLQSIVSENLARRGTELASAEAIVNEEVARFASWLQTREIVPTIVALRQRFESIRQAELQRLEPKLGGLTPEARAKVDEVTRLLVEKLLLTPIEQLKTVGDDTLVVAYADALHRLFTLAPAAKADEKPADRDEPLAPGARRR